MADVTTEPVLEPNAATPTPPSTGKALFLRKLAFVIVLLGLAALFVVLRSHLPSDARARTGIGTGLLAAAGASAFFLFGRESQRTLRGWRLFMSGWGLLLVPLLITIALGLAEEGWPTGKYNKPVARLLTWILIATIPAFLTALAALTRTYRLAAVLAMLSGLASLACTRWLFLETTPIKLRAMLPLDSILHIIGFLSKLAAFTAIPVGVALLVGGFSTWRAARREARASR
jgi:hypothetical protein